VSRDLTGMGFQTDLIVEHRRRLKLSQRGLAQAVGVSGRTVEYWEEERRIPDSVSLLRLARLFGVDPFAFFPERALTP